MNYVFGPVPSRRLGMSLGVDTIPLKTCNWNCVYCQLGRTIPLTNKRLEYFPRRSIFAEVAKEISSLQSQKPDWITFVGSGEPTLHTGLGWLIRAVKSSTDIPVAVITNGSLLYLPEVCEELCAADAVLPTLDAGTPKLYKKINRPHPSITFERLIDGLIAFRKEYSGWLWLEIMLVRGLNDTEQALQDISAAVERIYPDEIHINIPDRPPSETWVQPPDTEGLLRAQAILGRTARVVHPATGTFHLDKCNTITEAVMDIITRHPIRREDLVKNLPREMEEKLKMILDELVARGKARIIKRYGYKFYCAASTHHQTKDHS
ncbi:MAG: radical SAM protein [Anaerolineales bacterium]|nr:MAG: radical SAM protein [Anaerolineales bacterium]